MFRGQQADDEEGSIETDRPDFTEASSIVPLGMIQLEMGYTFVDDDDEVNGVRTRSHSGPETLLRYGASERFELRLAWNYAWERTTEAGVTTRNDGAEDVTVGTKIFFFEQDEWVPETALVLHLVAPTGADAFSNRHTEFELNLLYGWDLPEDFTLGASTGYSTATELDDLLIGGALVEIDDRHHVFHQSVTFGAPLTERARSFLEYFGFYYDGLAGGRPEHYLDGGFTFLVNNDLQLDLRAGAGLNDAADDFFTGAGFSVRR